MPVSTARRWISAHRCVSRSGRKRSGSGSRVAIRAPHLRRPSTASRRASASRGPQGPSSQLKKANLRCAVSRRRSELCQDRRRVRRKLTAALGKASHEAVTVAAVPAPRGFGHGHVAIPNGAGSAREANDTVALPRAKAGRDPYDKELSDLVGKLSTRSEDLVTYLPEPGSPPTTSSPRSPAGNSARPRLPQHRRTTSVMSREADSRIRQGEGEAVEWCSATW